MESSIGKYRLLGELGRGGMAVVYKAEDTSLGRVVALKVLPEHLSGDSEFTARLRSEARAAAALEHPNVVSIYEVGQEGDTHYIAMRYVEGMTLAEMIRERGALDLDTVTRIGEQVASALDYAHSKGIVHRDIKPGNIIVDREGRAYVTDFGIARVMGGTRLTASGSMVGTPEYMSPEQAMGKTVDESTDIYSFGVVLYEMLTGKVPFQADTPMGVGMKHVHENPLPPRNTNPGLPKNVDDTILACLAKLPVARPHSGREVMEAMRGNTRAAAYYVPQASVPTQPPQTPAAAPPYSQPMPTPSPFPTGALIGLSVFLGIVLLGIIIYLVKAASPPLPPIVGPPGGSTVLPPTKPGPSAQTGPLQDMRRGVSEDLICPESQERFLTEEDLRSRSARELDLMRNEIYARRGRAFKRKSLQDYFNSKPWYHPDPEKTDPEIAASMNEYEKTNAAFILQYEKKMGYQ